jgi:hypothetical protein
MKESMLGVSTANHIGDSHSHSQFCFGCLINHSQTAKPDTSCLLCYFLLSKAFNVLFAQIHVLVVAPPTPQTNT